LHYYRFRPFGELAIKELLYNEIYFASTKECNDPFDSKVFLSFGSDKESWKRLLEAAWTSFNHPEKQKWADQFSTYLSARAPLTFDAALRLNYGEALLSLQSTPDHFSALVLNDLLKRFINLYKPKDSYFVSFSQVCTDIIMWSHYASMHRGHCLIFKAIDGQLHQCPKRKKSAIRRTTPAGIASSMSYSIPESFTFQEISYSLDSTPDDAFSYFNEYVYGKKIIDEQERIEFMNRQNRQYLVKHDSWSYEHESRLTLPTPPAWLFGENIDYSQQERLFNYQPSQLVGIVLGARMEEQQKMRFREIIRDHIDRISRHDGGDKILFDFVLFQAELPDASREVVVNAEEIYTLTGTLSKNDSNFDQYLKNWQEGWATVIEGSRGSRKQFL
jgi:hypothetical protein